MIAGGAGGAEELKRCRGHEEVQRCRFTRQSRRSFCRGAGAEVQRWWRFRVSEVQRGAEVQVYVKCCICRWGCRGCRCRGGVHGCAGAEVVQSEGCRGVQRCRGAGVDEVLHLQA